MGCSRCTCSWIHLLSCSEGASGSMTPQQWTLAVGLSLASVFGNIAAMTTIETQKYTCKTFGSGVVKPFDGSHFYVSSDCPFTFARFTLNRVECDIAIRRGPRGLLAHVEIIINKIKTVLHGGDISVEGNSVSLPYDHTYQHIFRYGIYTRLRSSLLPLSVTWHVLPGGIDTLWVELEHELSAGVAGLCGKDNLAGNSQQLIAESVLTEETCQIRDPIDTLNWACRHFFSYTLDCLRAETPSFIQICERNSHSFEESPYIRCAFFKEVAEHCGNTSFVWDVWRSVTECVPPTCPGELVYVEQGAAFVPTCSNPNPRISTQDLTSSCVCPHGMVLNDHADSYQCVKVSSCPCEFAGRMYSTGDIRNTKCQSCVCRGGKWSCSENFCPPKCLIEGQYVTTFDGKQFVVPGKCTYMASKSTDWMVTIVYSKKEASLKMVTLQLYQETFTFAHNMVKFGEQDITDLHQSDHALVFWQSSMYVQVQTSFGMKLQVQVFPEVQVYVTPPSNHTAMISGLCGNSNGDTTDDFTTSSGIVENSAQAFALSWSVGPCPVNIPPTCINTDNEIYADEKCSMLNNPAGIFAECHEHIPTDQYHTACIQRTCNCGSNLHQCLCVALSSYANACARLGVQVKDWRKATNCTLQCPKNMQFSYQMAACNRTCRSLSGPDPCCALEDDPVEGCGCPEGTHLNQGQTCSPKAECVCHHHGGTTPPGPVVIDGRQCICENGELRCSKDCGCRNGKVCFHCSEYPVNTALKTCDSLSKPLGANVTCESGCYCPHGQFEDHRGNCVPRESCTCVFSGKIFSPGQQVKTNCKTCVCGAGQWRCEDEPCPGTCQVYGNGQYQTFDSKWYRFNGHCQYTLVEDYCGKTSGTFSVSVESVPCCDEALTCSRSIVLNLQDEVSLILSDMRVTKKVNKGWTLNPDSLYTIHTVGLYILISVPSRGITLIWDKHTRITVELHSFWRNRVCGLCGNFDSNEMNDLHMAGSAVVSGPLAFGNSWKADTPPCSDVTSEIFPCERHSYCSAWAQRRCLILTGDTFRECHLKVDPQPYYHACVQESCSCEFEGKFLGFCTSVAAYAEACSDQDICIDWRTPDLCPVYCDYYNEQGQCSWHYEACGKMMTCSTGNYLTHRLEGCYPRCPKEAPYFDENTGKCSPLTNCTCLYNEVVVQPDEDVKISDMECTCKNGTIKCPPPPTTTPATTLPTTTPSTMTSTTRETTVLSTTTTPIATTSTTRETTTLSTTTTPTSTIATNWPTSTSPPPMTTTSTTRETTVLSTTTTPIATTSTTKETTTLSTTTTPTTTIATSTTDGPTSTTAPPTITTSTTRETTVLSTTTTPTTTIETSTTDWPTSVTTETWSAEPSTISTKTSATTQATSSSPALTTTRPSSIPPTASSTAETFFTSPNVTATSLTPFTNASTTENWSTAHPGTSAPPTTASPTAASTTSTPTTTTSSTTSTAPTTQATSITNTTGYSTEHTDAPTSEAPSTSSTGLSTLLTNATTTPTTKTESTTTLASTASSTTQGSKPTEPPVITFSPSAATSPVTSSQIVFTSTQSTTSSSTKQTIFTTSEGTTHHASTATTGGFTSTSKSFPNGTTEPPSTSVVPTTPPECKCKDLKRKKSWHCGEKWTEDCFVKKCINDKIELTPVDCPETTIPTCPRGQATKVSDGCCETWKCDCQCELYGDPHYISFQGVAFDFLDDCTYTLVEERLPQHNLTIVVDNFYCIAGLDGSCAKGIVLRYQNSIASLSISPKKFAVQATLNNVTIEPPYEEHGFRFETTGYQVSLYLPEIRSYVSLTPSYTVVVNLAMEHFVNNTQGQCGVCGGPSCVRKGGQIEDDDCCDKTSYDWVYPDHSKPQCASAPRDVPCVPSSTSEPPYTPRSPTACPPNPLCDLLQHPVFENCSTVVNLNLKKKNCEFDSCRSPNVSCSSLEQAAEECKKAGFCIDWRTLTNGRCDVSCPEGLIYKYCSDTLDDFCYGGAVHEGAQIEKREGCFCPSGLRRAANHSQLCVAECIYCKGPKGEPKLPGEVWESNCMLCTCNNRTRSEECVLKPPGPVPQCPPGTVLVNDGCCGGQTCVEKNCTYNGKTYKVGDRWRDAARPCKSFSCSTDGIETETKVCSHENCPQEERIWDDEHCSFTCNNVCAPKMSNISVTIENCTTVVEMPVCRGQCESEPRLVLFGDLQIEQPSNCCREKSSERRSVTLHCLDLSTRHYTYKHLTACECRACKMWH